MSWVWVLHRGHSGDGWDLASTLCKYDLFVLGWARVRRVRRGSISSELIMCGAGVHSNLLPLLVISVEDICCSVGFGTMVGVWCLVLCGPSC